MRGWLPILTYHRVCDVRRDDDPLDLCTRPRDLERVLRYLTARRYRFVSLQEAVDAVCFDRLVSGKPVCLTFDDGYRDFYTTAYPLLQKYNATATVFVVTGCIGGTNRWDDGYGLLPAPILRREEIRDLDARGIEFGSHTVTHPRLPELPPSEQAREIVDSKRMLEELLGHEVRFFGYPHLGGDESTQALVRQAGYLGACGGEQVQHSPFLLHRVDVGQTSWPATLFRLWGWRYLLQRSRRLRSLRHSLLAEKDPVALMEARR